MYVFSLCSPPYHDSYYSPYVDPRSWPWSMDGVGWGVFAYVTGSGADRPARFLKAFRTLFVISLVAAKFA